MFGGSKKRFHWSESRAFARARARHRPMTAAALLRFFLLVAAVMLALVGFLALLNAGPGAVSRLPMAAAAALVFAAVLTALLPFFDRLPSGLYIDDTQFIVGKTVTRFADIESAAVGTLSLEGRSWRVLRYRARGVDHLVGLADDVDAQALEAYLRAVGIPEPP